MPLGDARSIHGKSGSWSEGDGQNLRAALQSPFGKVWSPFLAALPAEAKPSHAALDKSGSKGAHASPVEGLGPSLDED